jgi:hypothetical protein
MKKIKVLLLGLCLTQSLYSYEYDEKDVYHILSSTTLGYVGETLLHKSSSLSDTQKIIFGATPAIAIGAYKEYVDDKTSDNGDMVLNVLGALTGAYLGNYFNNKYFFKLNHEEATKTTKLTMGYNF